MLPGGARIRFLGTGTPISIDGLHQACILLETRRHKLLLDCGMTALVSLGRAGIDPREIDAVVISHLHGDHFGGLLPLLMNANVRPRDSSLIVAGPSETRTRVESAFAIFGWAPVNTEAATFVQLEPGVKTQVADCEVTALSVPHNSNTSPTALRVSVDGVTIGYSGDAGWSPALVDVARGADLFICAVWSFETSDPTFLDLDTLVRHQSQLGCRRIILTHLGPELTARVQDVPFEVATEASVIQL